ncbi:MAG: glycosyltransferase family 1 protein [Betaproteobacteria bacterium HGW-Betaproteobacteria-10]|nr:MAG: glycosyltransferase family 1 protein [Betaproteobacteria bacterium HGW-Betaproteobacteria-10]
MKIAIIRQRYNPFGGAERFVERALAALVSEGAAVTLITRNWEGAPRQGFKQITCNPTYSRLFGGRAARDRSFATAAQAEMAQGGFDITQSHERIPGCMIFRAGDGVHAAWLEHRARILTPLQRLSQAWSPYHRYVVGAEKAMFADPALKAVICNSQMVADEIQTFYGVDRSKLSVIYNGVDTTLFQPGLADEFRAVTRVQAGIPDDVPLLLFVGSGFERKGVPQLLRALARASNKVMHLAIVGADRKLPAMQALAVQLGLHQRVHFTGPLNDVRPWYGAADGFVLPTLYDPCPNAALEALACGLPIITSTTCGAQEWVKAGENGWVVDAVDTQQLAARLDDLAGLAGNAATRAAARASVEALTLPAMAERLLTLYRSLGSARGGQV